MSGMSWEAALQEDGGVWDARQRGRTVREKQASLQDKLSEPACQMCAPKCD